MLIAVPQSLPAPSPGEVVTYLSNHGWQLESTGDRWAVYRARVHRQDVIIEIPLRAGAPDYGRAVGMLVTDLARLEGRPAVAIVQDMLAPTSSDVRPGQEGEHA